jgi:hypothetical protein
MNSRFRFSYEPDWRAAPLAYWVHIPEPGSITAFDPPAPTRIPHKGFCFLRVELGEDEFVFSSPAQLSHFIEVLARKPLPTSRQLSAARGTGVGPNGHWLSRLPKDLKSPMNRARVVRTMKAVQAMLSGMPGTARRKAAPPAISWPGNTPEAPIAT